MVRQAKVLLNGIFRVLLLASALAQPACKPEPPREKPAAAPMATDFMSAKDIDVIYSEMGHIQARVTGPVVNRFAGEHPFMEFPKGFLIYIYDSAGSVETTISGDYGKRNESTHLMEAKGHVVVRNEIKHEQLNTEFLTWDEKKRIIYTRVPVKITTPDKVLFGDGLESNENFTRYSILHPRGEMKVQKDSL
jgi:LPS export ABC transporter protein LptC